jgi:hypothetical protein
MGVAAKLLDIINNQIEKKTRNFGETLFIGEIKSLDPIEIEIDEDIILYGNQLVLSKYLKPFKCKIEHTHKDFETEKNDVPIEIRLTSLSTNVSGSSDTGGSVTGLGTLVNGEGIEKESHDHDIKQQSDKTAYKIDDEINSGQLVNEDFVWFRIDPPLAVGNKVILLSFNNKKLFYVVERIEEP